MAHVVRKLGHAKLMMMCDKLHTQKKTAQKQREYTFYAHVLKVNLTFNAKKKLSIFFYQTHF